MFASSRFDHVHTLSSCATKSILKRILQFPVLCIRCVYWPLVYISSSGQLFRCFPTKRKTKGKGSEVQVEVLQNSGSLKSH